MRVLVTGGAGYIGSHVVLALLEAGHEPVTLDNLSKGHEEAVLGGKFIQADITDSGTVQQILDREGIEAVIHLAADSLVGESMIHPGKYFRTNIYGGLTLLEAMRACGVPYLVFSSTAAVYGEPKEIPIPEDHPAVPTNPYGFSKLTVEQMMAWYERAHGLRYISLRYFNAAGSEPEGRIGEDHNPETHLIPVVLQTALGLRREVELFGTDYPTPDGTCIRDYIHVMDLAEAHVLALKALAEGAPSEIYNLGNGQGYSNREVIEAARRVTGREIPVRPAPRRSGDPAVLVASSARIQQELGWRPRYPELERIIETAWRWFLAHPRGFRKD
ncbi:MAG: UDP-glucose 4-epimerase GalE [Firmicutes bacterium]|nr:UDP-glucose 4-epimerase GalE [Bacillota bacterium]